MKTYKVMLHRIESTHNNMRTDIISGIALALPIVGDTLTIVSKALNQAKTGSTDCMVRLFTTSTIQSVDIYRAPGIEVYTFKTQNSTYSLHVDIEDVEENT